MCGTINQRQKVGINLCPHLGQVKVYFGFIMLSPSNHLFQTFCLILLYQLFIHTIKAQRPIKATPSIVAQTIQVSIIGSPYNNLPNIFCTIDKTRRKVVTNPTPKQAASKTIVNTISVIASYLFSFVAHLLPLGLADKLSKWPFLL
jgi:hypothetical protein